jgi:hypothetical protein
MIVQKSPQGKAHPGVGFSHAKLTVCTFFIGRCALVACAEDRLTGYQLGIASGTYQAADEGTPQYAHHPARRSVCNLQGAGGVVNERRRVKSGSIAILGTRIPVADYDSGSPLG